MLHLRVIMKVNEAPGYSGAHLGSQLPVPLRKDLNSRPTQAI